MKILLLIFPLICILISSKENVKCDDEDDIYLEEEAEEWIQNEDELAKTRLGVLTSAAAGFLFSLQKECNDILTDSQEDLKRARFRLETKLSDIEDASDDLSVEICVNLLRDDLNKYINIKGLNSCVTDARIDGSHMDLQLGTLMKESQNVIKKSAQKVKGCGTKACLDREQELGRERNERAVSKCAKYAEHTKKHTMKTAQRLHACVTDADEELKEQIISIDKRINSCSQLLKKDEL